MAERYDCLCKPEYIFHLFAVLLTSASRQTDSVVIEAVSLQSSSLISPKKVDLNTAGPEISSSHQSKRKSMVSVRFLKTGVVLSSLLDQV